MSVSRQAAVSSAGPGAVAADLNNQPVAMNWNNQPAPPIRNNQPRLYSGRSQIYSFVRFVNLTLRKVDVVWLNYEGARVRYKTLQPDQFVDVNTFVGHPWIFRDADTGDKLVVHLQEVFEPLGYNISEGWPPQRKIVKISIPVYSLQDRCLQILRDLIPPGAVDSLDIPLTLRQEIHQLASIKSKQYDLQVSPGQDSPDAGADPAHTESQFHFNFYRSSVQPTAALALRILCAAERIKLMA